MKKFLLLAFVLTTPINANTAIFGLTDANICSWLEVKNTPLQYINEAKRRNLDCVAPRVKFKIDCGLDHIHTSKGCEKIPANSRKFNSEWLCELGFKKVNNGCEQIIRQPKLAPNAFKLGDSFACVSGYYKNKNSCDRLPANAYAYSTTEGFYCTHKYRKSTTQNKCILKPTPITKNKTSEIWNCSEGFKRVQNNCIQRTVFKDNFQFTSWFFNSGKPTIYFWLALFFSAIALDNIFSFKRKRKEKKAQQNAEIYYQELDQDKAKAADAKLKEEKAKRKADEEEVALAKRKEEEAETKRKAEEASPDESEIRIEKRADFEDLYFDQASDEWMDLVKYSIDESDAPIIMELDTTETSDDLLFMKKRQDQKRYRSKILKQLGLKSKARFAYISKTKSEVEPMCIKHNKFPWLIAALDGVSSDFKFIVELDSSASSYWKAKNNKISDINYAKLQHLMMVSGTDTVDFWCYWPGKEGILQKVERNGTYIESLFKSELEFANNLI